MATSTVEDYVKAIYALQQPLPRGELASLGRVAAAVDVVPGTATTMVKALSEAGLVHYEPRQGVRLTSAGMKLALHVLRRHRLIESFLVRVLKLDWSEVHAEAEALEHALSDRLVERIDEYLGRPAYDPHGDPIPSASGKVERRQVIPLTEAVPGEPMIIARVTDQASAFLAYANERGLVPDARVVVESVDPIGGSVSIVLDADRRLTLGSNAAGKVDVRPIA